MKNILNWLPFSWFDGSARGGGALAGSVLALVTSWAGAAPLALNLPADPVPDHVTNTGRMAPNESKVFAQLDGPGCIRRIWFVQNRPHAPDRLLSHAIGSGIPGGAKPLQNRKMILRIYFDGAKEPQVEAPVGDFFGLMHGQDFYAINTPFVSAKPANGYTCYFEMPFAKSARVEFANGPDESAVHLQIDWHRYPGQELTEPRRFCAQWRREMPAPSYGDDYMILDADGPGNLIGFFLGVRLLDNVDRWSHGGAENIYLDGEGDNPAYLRGLGGEDTFGTSFGGVQHPPETDLYDGMPYYALEDVGEARGAQRVVGYRFYVRDPIPFKKSIRFQFGSMRNDICSMVYWYQEGTPRRFAKMPDWPQLLPGARIGSSETALPMPDSGSWGLGGLLDNRQDAAIRQAAAAKSDGPAMPPGEWTEDFSVTDSTAALLNTLLENADGAAARQALAARGTVRRMATGTRVEKASYHGFVDFNRVHRTTLASKATNVGRAAEAISEIDAPETMNAQIRVSWDDHLVLRVNDGAALDLGAQPNFRSRTVVVPLQKGRNTISVVLSNETGSNFGGWAFAFRATAPNGTILVPHYRPPAAK